MPDIPKEMRAQVVSKPGSMPCLKTVPVPTDIKPDEVLVKLSFSGICHTDLHTVKHDWPITPKSPIIPGHEGVGQVVKTGSAVSTVKIGDWVGIKWINSTCLECSFCTTGQDQLCQRAKMSGFSVDGTFAEYAVGQATSVVPIPEKVTKPKVKPELAPVLCAGVTVYRGLKESGVKAGQSVAIVGAGGGLGSLAIQYAIAMGVRPIGIDSGDEKEKLCREMGAEAFVDFKKMSGDDGDGMAEAVKKAVGGDGLGPHAVLVLSAAEKPFEQAMEYVRPTGTVVCIGLPPNGSLKAPIFSTVVKMVSIRGSYVGNRADSVEAVDFFARDRIKVPVTVVGLGDVPDVFEKMDRGEVVGRYVVDFSKE